MEGKVASVIIYIFYVFWKSSAFPKNLQIFNNCDYCYLSQ